MPPLGNPGSATAMNLLFPNTIVYTYLNQFNSKEQGTLPTGH